VVEQILA